MTNTEEKYGWLAAPQAYVSLKNEEDKVVIFERAGLLFVFNFHPTKSFSNYRIGVEEVGGYHVILSTDDKRLGGFENISASAKYETTPMEWNNRKNWTQVRSKTTLAQVLLNLEVLERSAASSAPAGDIRTTFLSTR